MIKEKKMPCAGRHKPRIQIAAPQTAPPAQQPTTISIPLKKTGVWCGVGILKPFGLLSFYETGIKKTCLIFRQVF